MKTNAFGNSSASIVLAALVLMFPYEASAKSIDTDTDFMSQADKLGFQNWISIKHIGPEDKPLPEFIVAFTSASVDARDEFMKTGVFKVITLPLSEMKPLLDFIKTKGNTRPMASRKFGAFRLLVFSGKEPVERYFVGGKQSRALFQRINGIVKKYPIGKTKKHGTDQMLQRISGAED